MNTIQSNLIEVAREISEVSNWLHRIANADRPLEISRQEVEEMGDRATRTQEFVLSLYKYLHNTERVQCD